MQGICKSILSVRKKNANNGGDFVKMTRNVQKLSKMTKICEKR